MPISFIPSLAKTVLSMISLFGVIFLGFKWIKSYLVYLDAWSFTLIKKSDDSLKPQVNRPKTKHIDMVYHIILYHII